MTTVRVFVNGKGVDASAAGTFLDAVMIADTAEATEVMAGRRGLTDSRGLPVDAQSPAYGGAIIRTVSVRAASSGTT